MNKFKAYLLSSFSQVYFSLFLPLFVIASVVMLVKIASFTAVIQLSLFEMSKLYLFMLPDLLFYTLPVTFFVAAVITISKLSFDNEMIVIFSLGINPSNITKFFVKLAFFQSLLLFILFFVISPHTKNLAGSFLHEKRTEAKFNIQASEYGHKFGDWLIFVGVEESEGHFSNVILFNQQKEEETLIIANNADIVSKKNVLKLQLSKGKGFNYSKDSLSQMSFQKMYINDTSVSSANAYKNTLQYWLNPEKRERMTNIFILNALVSLFPLLSVLLILGIGVINARHQKGYTYFYIFLTILFYYGAAFGLSKAFGLYNIAFVSLITLILTSFFYYKKIMQRY